MRHFRNIRNDRLSCDILTDSKGKIAFEILKLSDSQQISQKHHAVFLIRYFDADPAFPDRCLNPDIRRRQI